MSGVICNFLKLIAKLCSFFCSCYMSYQRRSWEKHVSRSTFEILRNQEDRADVMVLNESFYLRRDSRAIKAHHKQLALA